MGGGTLDFAGTVGLVEGVVLCVLVAAAACAIVAALLRVGGVLSRATSPTAARMRALIDRRREEDGRRRVDEAVCTLPPRGTWPAPGTPARQDLNIRMFVNLPEDQRTRVVEWVLAEAKYAKGGDWNLVPVPMVRGVPLFPLLCGPDLTVRIGPFKVPATDQYKIVGALLTLGVYARTGDNEEVNKWRDAYLPRTATKEEG